MNYTTWHDEDKIDGFKDEYGFLSNFHPAWVYYEGREYGCVEAAYQAAKMTDPLLRIKYELMTGAQAKKASMGLELPYDWFTRNRLIMFDLLVQKFAAPEMHDLLQKTGTRQLVEGNRWHDNYWGVCHCNKCMHGISHNHLGKMLMSIRKKTNGTNKPSV